MGSNKFVWVVVILNKRVSAPAKEKKERKRKKEEQKKSEGVKLLFLAFLVVLVCDNICVQAHVSSLI